MENWIPWSQVPELATAPEIVTGGTPVSPAPTANPVGDQIYAPPATNPYAGTMGGAGGPTVNPQNYLWQSTLLGADHDSTRCRFKSKFSRTK